MSAAPESPAAEARSAPDGTAHSLRRDRLTDRFTLMALACIAIPLVVALISVGQTHWYPTGDMAQAELHVNGFFRHPPLVGAAGRIGDFLTPYGQGSHPGPAMWVALLPVYLLFGRSSFGLMVSMSVVQFTFIVAGVWMARRLAGAVAGLAVATAAAVLVRSLGPAVFLEPWNPWPAIFAFFAFLVATWGVLCGRHRWLPAGVFSGMFAVQCHAGYIPLVGALLAWATIATAIRWRRDGRSPGVDAPTATPEVDRTAVTDPRHARWFAAAVVVFVAMWVPPVLDQLRREPGNLRILWRHFSSTTDADGTPRQFVGITSALRAFAGEFSVAGPWVRGSFRQPTEPPNWFLFLAAVLVAGMAAAVLSRMHRSPQRAHVGMLFMLLGAGVVVGVASTARIFGEFYDYVIRWWWVIAVLVAVACVLVAAAGRRSAPFVAPSLLVASLLAGAFATANAADAEIPSPRNSALVGGVTPQVAAALDPAGGYLIRWYDPATLGGVPYGVLLELERDGFRVGVDAPASAGALPHRVIPEPSATAVLWVVAGDVAIDAFRARADATELGFYDQRSPAEIAESDALRTRLVARLEQLGLGCLVPTLDTQYGLAPLVIGNAPVPQDVRVLAADYNLLGLPVAVFSVPIGAPLYFVTTEGCPQ
jgi:hypothetical protein